MTMKTSLVLLLLLFSLFVGSSVAFHRMMGRNCRKWVSSLLIASTFVAPLSANAIGNDGTVLLPNTPPVPPTNYYERAQGFYDAWNARDVKKAITYFSDDVLFVDAQYSRPFVGKTAVKKYITDCADSLPGWAFIIDDYSEDITRRKVGLKWHVSDSSNIPLPFPNKGLSFLSFDENGLIKECTDMVEPTVKTGSFQLPLLRTVTKILRIK